MDPTQPVTLQINLTPGDLRTAVEIVPHQLRQLGSQVAEILLTIDTQGANLAARRPDADAFARLMTWIDTLRVVYPHLRATEADYSKEMMRTVSRLYFGRDTVPRRTYRGAFYAYFEGLRQAASNYVLHLDSDILLGGGSTTWVREAVIYLEQHSETLFCCPLPGPPTADLALRSQVGESLSTPRGAFRFRTFSTRVFLVDRRRIEGGARKLPWCRASLRQQLRAYLEGFSPLALPEDLVTDYLQSEDLYRVDFLGQTPGMWTLHPPYRNEAFFAWLPAIVRAVESGQVPEAQRGDHDLNDSMVDWGSARKAVRNNRWWKRYF